MVVTRSYQILLPKNDFLPFSHWYSHCNPKKLPTWEGVELQRNRNVFWNQWSSGNNLGTCTIGDSEIFENKNHPTAYDEISVLATLIVQVAPLVIFLDKRGLNAFLKPFMLVFNERGNYARPPRLLRVATRSSTTAKRWHRPNVINLSLNA